MGLLPNSILIKDDSFTIKFILFNKILKNKDNLNSLEFDNKFYNATLATEFHYNTITTYDLFSAVFTSFIITIVLGFIFFWLEWRKFDTEKK
jgi:hypothetical protein